MKEKTLIKRAMCLSAVSLVLVGLATAQDDRGTIRGTARYPQAGMVANATAMVENADTRIAVSPVEAAGFKQEANR